MEESRVWRASQDAMQWLVEEYRVQRTPQDTHTESGRVRNTAQNDMASCGVCQTSGGVWQALCSGGGVVQSLADSTRCTCRVWRSPHHQAEWYGILQSLAGPTRRCAAASGGVCMTDQDDSIHMILEQIHNQTCRETELTKSANRPLTMLSQGLVA